MRPRAAGALRAVCVVAGLSAMAWPVPAAPPAAPRTYTIGMANLGYGPAPARLRVGDTIVWVNQDLFRHTATARDKQFDVDLPPKARARTRLGRPGVVNVYCRYHPGMTLKLQVAP